ncbi:MAG: nicotinate-nucleotide adenylyltransferase [Burkholderiales bacterium]
MDETGPIGILGGTFDPVHYGHLRLAEEAADALGLTQVRLIPAALPNLRARPGTKPHQRLEMTRLAAAHNPRLAVDDRELRREGMSYTVDTLDELRAELGATRPIWLILGADAFLRLPAWSRWLQLFDLAHIAVATRPGYALDEPVRQSAELAAEWNRRFVPDWAPPPPPRAGAIVPSAGALPDAPAGALPDAPAGAIVHLPIPLLEISASDLRARMSRGASVRYLLPPAVVDYIAAHRLYSSQ